MLVLTGSLKLSSDDSAEYLEIVFLAFLFNDINCCMLFDANAILVEKQ